jgi:hypothetical protein
MSEAAAAVAFDLDGALVESEQRGHTGRSQREQSEADQAQA